MRLKKIWDELNKSLSVLIIGAAFGFAFPHFVWEPYQNHIRQEAVRLEVAHRLNHIGHRVEHRVKNDPSSLADDVHGGGKAVSLDIQYQEWSLAGLIAYGWGPEKVNAVQKHFDNFKLSEEELKEQEKVNNAKESLKEMRKQLGLTEQLASASRQSY